MEVRVPVLHSSRALLPPSLPKPFKLSERKEAISNHQKHPSFLDSAYRATTYSVELPTGRYGIRIGNRHPELDEFASSFNATEWAYITAWNPRSVPQTLQRNRAENARLEMELNGLKRRWFRGTSEPDDGSAGEESLLAFICRRDAESLGRTFEQNAIVVGRVGQKAELVWLRSVDGND